MSFGAFVTILALLCGLVVLPAEGHAADMVEWRSAENLTRLARADRKTDFFPLSNNFIGQENAIFCGPVSAAIVLNALRLGRCDGLPVARRSIAPGERVWLPAGTDPFYGRYTPNNVINDRTKSRLEVLGKPLSIGGAARNDLGLQLRQLAQMLRSHGLKVVIRVVYEGAEASAIRREIAANLAAADDFVLVNYARRALGRQGGGHISPPGAYDPASDSFLVMDMNPSRAPWVRVPAADLIAAMRTFDTVGNRGYLLVSEGR